MMSAAPVRTVTLDAIFAELQQEIAEALQTERAYDSAMQVARAKRESAERHRDRLLALLAPSPEEDTDGPPA